MDTLNTFENITARAFKADLDALILAYEKEQTLLFEPFTRIWRDMSFTLIYGGQIVAAELKAFTELLFRIAVKYLIAERTLFARTGALYALYGLYYKQPINCWIKIRLTYEQMKCVTELVNCLKENQAQEALFVYAKLCADTAFDYVATELPRGLEIKFGRQQFVGVVSPFVTDAVSVNNSLKHFVSNNLGELETVDRLYASELKEFKANPKVMLIGGGQDGTKTIGEKLRGLFEEMRSTKTPPSQTTANEEVDDIQTRRRKLRSKAQKADVKSYSEKQRQISRMLDDVRVKFEEVSEDDSD